MIPDTPNPADSSLDADAVIAGGTVYDGTGAAGVMADVALRGGMIVAVAPGLADRLPHARRYDAAGCAVSPGFIDIHTHSDLAVLGNPEMVSSVHQGVTTEMTGNCGTSPGILDIAAPAFEQERAWMEREGVKADWTRLSGFLGMLEQGGISTNMAILTGHGTARKAVMGFAERAPDAGELDAMRAIVARALEDGAYGLSTGLEYNPGCFAQADEISALAALAHAAGGFYASHMRNEGDTLLESVNETIAVGERTGIPVQVSHHKSEGMTNWGKVDATLARMQAARDAGLDVLTDQYPYTAFMTGLTLILLPEWARKGSPEDVMARITDPAQRPGIERQILASGLDFDSVQIGIARAYPEVQGLTLSQLGAQKGVAPVTAAVDLLIAENCWVAAAHFALNESDVERVMSDAHTMIGSDGVATTPAAPGRPHPRAYGTFPRVLGRYVRERGVLTLPDAIRRMTSLPARRMRLADRGRIAPGMRADVTVFRPDLVIDCATFIEPHQFPMGIEQVFVNGTLTVERGRHTGARAGQVLRRPG